VAKIRIGFLVTLEFGLQRVESQAILLQNCSGY
jgi:hypothetical protein